MEGTDVCPNGGIQCESKAGPYRCIEEKWRCDSDNDCKNGEDEAGCKQCREDLFQCKNYLPPYWKCIDWDWVCDNMADCDDMEDEQDCAYLENKTPEPSTKPTTERSSLLSPKPRALPQHAYTTGTTTLKTTTTTTKTATTSTLPTITTGKEIEATTKIEPASLKWNSSSPRMTTAIGYPDGTSVFVQEKQTDKFDIQQFFKSSYLVYSLLAVSVVLVVVIVILCCLKCRRKSRRREDDVPETKHLVRDKSFSTGTGSSVATEADCSDHEYEDIDKYRQSGLLLAQTNSHSWTQVGLGKHIFPDHLQPDRDSSYAFVLTPGTPQVQYSHYEQTVKCMDNTSTPTVYLSVDKTHLSLPTDSAEYEQPISKSNDYCAGYDEQDIKPGVQCTDAKSKSNDSCDGYEEAVRVSNISGHGYIEPRNKSNISCSSYEEQRIKSDELRMNNVNDSDNCEESNMYLTFQGSSPGLSSFATGYDESIARGNTPDGLADIVKGGNVRDNHAILYPNNCSFAERGSGYNDYLQPVDDDYLNPV